MVTLTVIYQKTLDESTLCPVCQAAMLWIEAEQYGQEIQFHECSSCQHQVFQSAAWNCHCPHCLKQRKQVVQQTRAQETRQQQRRKKEDFCYNLNQLSFIQKLFLLSLLDDVAKEDVPHDEFIYWDRVKYRPISPNYLFQQHLIKQMLQQQILLPQDELVDNGIYVLNIKLDGYSDPSLFSVCQQLRLWFYHQLSQGIPFKDSEEVKDALFLMFYQELVQFMQAYCRTWQVQISGNQAFQKLCYQLLDRMAVGQIYYMMQNALEYLHQQRALQARNDQFINTNLLKKTLQQYHLRGTNEKWEAYTLPRPHNIPLSKMSEILFIKFLNFDENIFIQPVWKVWKTVAPRLGFFAQTRCMHCGSEALEIDYDAQNYVSLTCQLCKQQDHYFTQ